MINHQKKYTMALFIGGPLDGKLIEVDPSLEHVEVAITHETPTEGITLQPNKPSKGSFTDVFFYRREMLSCPTDIFPVFVPRSYNCTDVMQALIQSYHQSVLQAAPNEPSPG